MSGLPPRPDFYGAADEAAARAYIERSFGSGAYISFEADAPDRDEILIAGLMSARDSMMQSANCRRADGMPFKVFAGLVEIVRPNAFATVQRGLHLCGMNAGTYGAIFELCNFVMAQPGLFVDVGDPERETATPLPSGIVPGFWLIDQLKAHGTITDKSLAPTLMPKCPERYNFAIAMTLHMMRFVWFHELYHCLNGHVGALCKVVPSIRLNELPDETSAAMLVELDQASLPLGRYAFLQAIELDADRSALWGAFRMQLEDKENIFALQQQDRHQRIKLCLFSAYLMTFVMEQAARRLAVRDGGSHPGSYTRLHDLVRTTASHLLDAYAATHQLFQDVVGELKVLRKAIPSLVEGDKILADCLSPRFQAALDEKEEQVDIARRHCAGFAFR